MPNPRLPEELLDQVVDFLHDTKYVLRDCCLTSKSWIPRTRKHLFADIKFREEENLQSWKETFPDPLTSPACYTNTLYVGCSYAITPADADAAGWLRGFSRVARLSLDGYAPHNYAMEFGSPPPQGPSLVPFHGFSPVIKSLHVFFATFPPLDVLDLMFTFPLLEDLTVITYNGWTDKSSWSTVTQPQNLPAFTGTLKLCAGGVKSMACILLSLPGGIHFRKLTLAWPCEEGHPLAMALLESCSHTLESLDVSCGQSIKSMSASTDLSKAVKLRDVVFRPEKLRIGSITTALQTITPKHQDLQQISIYVHFDSTLTKTGADVRQTVGEQILGEWLDLDRLLAQLWESRSIRLKVISTARNEGQGMKNCIESLLPEITKRDWVSLGYGIKRRNG